MSKKRRIFQWFTIALVFVCACAVYANLIVDDTPVRNQGLATLSKEAGCAGECKLESFTGERNIVQLTLHYQVVAKGAWTVVCRRAFVIGGDYTCAVTSRPASAPAKS